MARRRTEITLETRRVLIVRRRRRERVLCALCAGEVEMFTTAEAAAIRGLTEREVFRLAEARLLHSAETTDGLLFVCLGSLLKQV